MSNNTSYGIDSLHSITNTAKDNTAIGAYASYHNTTTTNNTSIGANSAFFNTTGSNNTSVGAGSLCTNVSGSLNTAIGSSALDSSANYNQNVAVGAQALYSIQGNLNTAIGTYAGMNIDGSGNTFLGANTGFDLSKNTYNYSSAIGYNAQITQSNQIVLGTTNQLVSVPGSINCGTLVPGNINPNTSLNVIGWLRTNQTGNIKVPLAENIITDSSGNTTSNIMAIGGNYKTDNEIDFWNTYIGTDYTKRGWTFMNSNGYGTAEAECMSIYRNGDVMIAGKVGIGKTTLSPGYALDVSGNVHVSGDVSCNTIHAYGLATLNGNVGIGTSSPTYTLDVSGKVHISGDLSCNTIHTSGNLYCGYNLANNNYLLSVIKSTDPSNNISSVNLLSSFLYPGSTGDGVYLSYLPNPPDPNYYWGAIGSNFYANHEVNFWNTCANLTPGYSYDGTIGWAFLATMGKNNGQQYNNAGTVIPCMTLDRAGNAILNGSLSFATTNTIVGLNTPKSLTGTTYNTAIGNGALQYNSTQSNNTAIGSLSLENGIIGSNNTALGYKSGYYITDSSGTLGSNNTFIGNGSTYSTTSNITNSTAIGCNATVTKSHQIMLGTSSETVVCPYNLNVTGDLSCNTIHAYGLTVTTGNISLPPNNKTYNTGNMFYGDNINSYMRQFVLASQCYMDYYGTFLFRSVSVNHDIIESTTTLDQSGNLTVGGSINRTVIKVDASNSSFPYIASTYGGVFCNPNATSPTFITIPTTTTDGISITFIAIGANITIKSSTPNLNTGSYANIQTLTLTRGQSRTFMSVNSSWYGIDQTA